MLASILIACSSPNCLPQQPNAAAAVVVGVPAVFAEAVRAPLASAFGSAVEVRPLTAVGTTLPSGVGALLLCDEWMLGRLAGTGLLGALSEHDTTPERAKAGEFVLPCVGDCAIAVASDVDTGGRVPDTWEEVGMNPMWREHLGLVAPEVDGTPWLLAMLDRIGRGESDAAGIALWRTLDAHVGRLWSSYDDLGKALLGGQVQLAVGLRGQLDEVVRHSDGRLRLLDLRGGHRGRFGLAVVDRAPAAAGAVVARLLQPQLLSEIAAAAGLEVIEDREQPLAGAEAVRWWASFQSTVRGRGRGVEQIADWLDIGFGALVLVVLWLLMRSHRRREAGDAKRVPRQGDIP